MPPHNPIPDRKPRTRSSSLADSIAQAERMVQIVFILPCAGFIGWLAGAWLGNHFHQSWMPMAGIVAGILSGLIGAIRMAIAAGADSGPGAAKNGKPENSKDAPRGRP